MTLSQRMSSAARWGVAARRGRAAWGTVVVPPETKALIDSRKALRVKAVVEEAGAWMLLVGFWALSLLVVAVAWRFV
jgi:hypothetical protein